MNGLMMMTIPQSGNMTNASNDQPAHVAEMNNAEASISRLTVRSHAKISSATEVFRSSSETWNLWATAVPGHHGHHHGRCVGFVGYDQPMEKSPMIRHARENIGKQNKINTHLYLYIYIYNYLQLYRRKTCVHLFAEPSAHLDEWFFPRRFSSKQSAIGTSQPIPPEKEEHILDKQIFETVENTNSETMFFIFLFTSTMRAHGKDQWMDVLSILWQIPIIHQSIIPHLPPASVPVYTHKHLLLIHEAPIVISLRGSMESMGYLWGPIPSYSIPCSLSTTRWGPGPLCKPLWRGIRRVHRSTWWSDELGRAPAMARRKKRPTAGWLPSGYVKIAIENGHL